VIIRCERCSTLYELDEALLAPEGSSVQCARCQAVFTVIPSRPGPAAAGPSTPPPPGEVKPQAAPAPSVRAGEPAARTARPEPHVYRRPQPTPVAAPPRGHGRAGAPARDAVSAMDARLRTLARWKLAVVPLGVLVLLLLAWGAWSAWRRGPDPETQRQRAEAMALIAQDDAASLARAVELLDAIQRGDRASSAAAGERGLARALLAAAHVEEVEPLEERLAAATAERGRLEREQPPGFEDALRALAMEVTRIEVELTPRRQKAEALQAQAAGELQGLAGSPRSARDAARGQAVLAVLDGDTEEVQRTTALLRTSGPDPWADLVELWAAVGRDGAARDQAIPKLQALVTAHPELIRARFVLARALLSAGRHEEAISTVASLLAANPRHERAQRLRSQLTAPPPVSAAPPPPHPVPVARPAPPVATPPAAASNVVVPAPTVPAQAATNQPVAPSPEPAAPAAVEPPPVPPPAPPPGPPPRPKPPEPSNIPDPTQG
jgi:predicted Zn finger-like uncharacterized protein